MNCLDFRRQLLADPFCKEAQLIAHEADCASCAPFARAILASRDSAPKLMSDTNSGMSSRSGLLARGPITTSVPTGSSSSRGAVAS